MAHRFSLIDTLLHFASTPRARSVVTWAAVSFAVCHLVVFASAPGSVPVVGNHDAELPRQLLYCAAVLCRFAVPMIVMIVGTIYGRPKAKLGA
jgi:hypothetical protein